MLARNDEYQDGYGLWNRIGTYLAQRRRARRWKWHLRKGSLQMRGLSDHARKDIGWPDGR